MLQFWRKTEQNRLISTNNNIDDDDKDVDNNRLAHNCNKPANSSLLVSFEEDRLFELSDYYESIKEKRHSLLPRTLQDVLDNKDVLDYFVKFMETRQASNLINCWLDIDRFELEFNRDDKSITVPKSSKTDSLSISTTDLDSITTDSNSLNEISSSDNQRLQFNECCDKLTGDNDNDNDDDESIRIKALAIYKKYLSQDSNNCITLINDRVRNEINENVCNEKYLCFNQLKQLLFDIIDKEYLQNFLMSDYYCKYQINILTNDQLILDDILYNETILFYFMEYLEQENVRNLLEFWLSAINFQKQYQQNNESFDLMEAQNDAIIIYDKYFSLQAYYPLNLGNKLRIYLEQNICNENGLINLNCFQLPINIVEYILDKNYLKSFLNSQLFYKYLTELINATETNSNYFNLKYDCCNNSSSGGSEKSFNTTTTNSTLFLALEIDNNSSNNNIYNHKRIKNSSKDMTIDTRELSDPNTLWKRKNIKKSLNCGYVTDYGKFETDLIPPDRKEFGLKNIMKKLINTIDEQERKREEMAWQVAEMIVRDVTNITLKQNNT